MQFFHAVRRVGMCIALLVGPASTRLVPQAQAHPALAGSTCRPPKTLPVPGAVPQVLALDSVLHVLIVGTTNGLVLLDSCSGKVLKQITAGGTPTQLAVDEGAGRALALVQHNNGQTLVRLFDISRRKWMGNVQLPPNAVPTTIVVPTKTHLGLILDPGDVTLWIVDTRSGKVVQHVPNLPGALEAIGMDGKERRAFVASTTPNVVTIINTKTWQVLGKTPLPGWPWALAVSVGTRRVFVATQDNSGHHTKGLSILDSRSGQLLTSVSLSSAPQALAVDENLGLLYVATQDSNGHPGVLVLSAKTGEPIGPRRAGPPCNSLTVDSRNDTVFYLDRCGGQITTVSSGGSTPTPPVTKPTPIPTSTPPASPAVTPTSGIFDPAKYHLQVLFDTNFAGGWDRNWETSQPQAGRSCISSSNPGNQYVLSIMYSGHCTNNLDYIERWSPLLYASGAISTTFIATGRAAATLIARDANDGLYFLEDLILGSKGDYICLGKRVTRPESLQCATPAPVAPGAHTVLTLLAQGKVLTAFFNNAALFSYTDPTPLLAPGQWAFLASGAGPSAAPGDKEGRVSFTHLTLYGQ